MGNFAFLMMFALNVSETTELVENPVAEEAVPEQSEQSQYVVDESVLRAVVGKKCILHTSKNVFDGVTVLSVERTGVVVQMIDNSVVKIPSYDVHKVVLMGATKAANTVKIKVPKSSRSDREKKERKRNLAFLKKASKLDKIAHKKEKEASNCFLLGGAATVLGGLGFAVSLFVPVPTGFLCLGLSCLTMTGGGITALVGSGKNSDASEARAQANQIREMEMAY